MYPMDLAVHGHACVSITTPQAQILIDPGVFSDHERLSTATAVLVTHSHGDHLDSDSVVRAMAGSSRLVAYGPADVVEQLGKAGAHADRVHLVVAGDRFTVGDIAVEVVAMEHGLIHADLPSPDNVGYLLGDAIFHPGDSLAVVDRPVDTLLLPVAAPWLTLGDAIDFARRVGARVAVPIHDAISSEAGVAVSDGMAAPGILPTGYRRLRVGEHLTVARA